MKFKETLFGYDFNITSEVSGFKVKSISTESQSSLLDTGAVSGTTFLLNGLNANMVKLLKSGEAFLEFWIEAIDHTKPTANNKLYPANVFQAGLECKGFQNMLKNIGSVPGRFALLYGNI